MEISGILLVDKPAGWTSHDVVAKLRGILGQRRIGHSGTLDPMATGLLVVFIGRATRAVEFAESDEKEYSAEIRLGLVTDTQDSTGTVLEENAIEITRARLEAALTHFRGEISQIPPMYSAVKVNGRKLYELARSGRTADRKPRRVFISQLELTGGEGDSWALKVTCSKGTYIRTLCHDIGAYLGCGAAMSALRRTRAGAFTIESASTLEEIEAAAKSGGIEKLLLPTDSLFASYPRLDVTPESDKRIRCGAQIKTPAADGVYRVYAHSGFLALSQAQGGILTSIKSFFEV